MEEDVGICDLNGDLETRLLLRTCLKLEDERRATSPGGGRSGESRCLAIRRGDTSDLPLTSVSGERGPDGGELQPIPDSRRIEDFIGSGELDRRRSRKG